MQKIVVSLQERWAQTTPKIHKNKKKYDRKVKHRKNGL